MNAMEQQNTDYSNKHEHFIRRLLMLPDSVKVCCTFLKLDSFSFIVKRSVLEHPARLGMPGQ